MRLLGQIKHRDADDDTLEWFYYHNEGTYAQLLASNKSIGSGCSGSAAT